MSTSPMNINLKQTPIFILVGSVISTFTFWYIQSQFQQSLLLIALLFAAIYLGYRKVDKFILFLPALIGWSIVFLIK
ncbi:hypothetical protein ACG9XS_15915 [Acinetobacter gyllenbergii]|uniref:hypothetical protein n=1 Tax=Acinetobacter gyllenbergii TaxID=134534 RepID=UPI003AF6CF82